MIFPTRKDHTESTNKRHKPCNPTRKHTKTQPNKGPWHPPAQSHNSQSSTSQNKLVHRHTIEFSNNTHPQQTTPKQEAISREQRKPTLIHGFSKVKTSEILG